MNLETSEVIAACEAGDFESAAGLINAAATPTKKSTEASRYTWLGLQDKFGVDRVTGWRVAIRVAITTAEVANNIATAESLSMFRETMAGSGYSFADDRTQAQLGALRDAGIISAGDFDDLSALGFVAAAVVTAEQVEAEWTRQQEAKAAIRIAAARSAIVAALNRISSRVALGGDLPSLVSVQSEIAANWPEV